MKALKGKAAEFFKKKQQKKQDINQIIHQLQCKSIATQVGIAEEEIPFFKWFFDQLEKFKLPPNFIKQLNQQKTQLSYLNKNTNQLAKQHPLLSMIRTFFYTEYKSNKSAFTFSIKKQKLLPYVEDRMMKNTISLNSKRRQAEKLNLQKDQNGKIVLSKMARIKPDTKNLVSARSYMLKMLIEKLYTTKQIWGKGKRAKALSNIMNQKYKDVEEQAGEIFQTIDPQDLQTYQSIFTQAARFYQDEFGDILGIPHQLRQTQAYKNSIPQNIVRYLSILNISKNQIEFYWFGRLMDCLPIPPNWSINYLSNSQSYFYQPLKLKFDIHPSYIYVVLQMNKFKDFFSSLTDERKTHYYENRKMTFIDFFERQYTVDIYGLLLQQELKHLPQNTDNPLLKQENARMREQNANDWMVVEAVVNSEMKAQQYPLIGSFCDFWASKNFYDQEWIPTVSPFGQITWSDSVNYSSIDYCPYKQILKSKLEYEREKLPNLSIDDFKYKLRQQMKIVDGKIQIQPFSKAEIQLIKVSEERQKFIQHYIKYFDDPNPPSYNIKNSDMKYYFDQIFLCPFDLDVKEEISQLQQKEYFELQSEQDQVPLWKEKVKARKFSSKIKNAIKQNFDFQQLKELVRSFTEDTTAKNEPQKLQQMKDKLRNIRNFKDLEQFVENITDIDAREERKRQQLERMRQKKDDDDIFGSEQEDVKIQQVQAESRKQQQSQQEIVSQAESQKFQQQKQQQQDKQFSSSSESQPEQQNTQQNLPTVNDETQNQQNVQKEIQKQRSQYSFIKQMKQERKVYQKSQKIQKADTFKVQTMVKQQIKKNKKTLKYANTQTKNTNNFQKKLINNLKNQQLTEKIKKNLIQTNFKYSTVPDKDERIYKFEDNKTASEYLKDKNLQKIKKIPQIKNYSSFHPLQKQVQFDGFQSEIEQDQEPSQIISLIQSLPKKQQTQEDLSIFQDDYAEYEIKVPPKNQKHNQKNEIILLQPIKRTVPDIQYDTRLRHVNSLDIDQQFNLLNTLFIKKTNVNQTESPTKIRIRNKSTSNLNKALQSTINSSQKSMSFSKNSPTKKKQGLSPLKKKQINGIQSFKTLKTDRILEQKLFPSVSSSYNRVCLGNTASTLLISQPIKRKSQLLVLQARKSLLQKGRGLDTYMSRKY